MPFRSTAHSFGNVGPINVPKPLGLLDGDAVLVLVDFAHGGPAPGTVAYVRGGAPIATETSGSNGYSFLYSFTAASEGAILGQITFGGIVEYECVVLAYSGTPGLDTVATPFVEPSQTTSHFIPAATAADYGSTQVYLYAGNSPSTNQQLLSTPPAGFVERTDQSTPRDVSAFIPTISAGDRKVPRGTSATATLFTSTFSQGAAYVVTLRSVPLETSMQTVFTGELDGSHYHGITSEPQVATTLTALGNVAYTVEADFRFGTRMIVDATGTHALDFTNYDAYIETQDAFFGVLFDDSEKPTDTSRRLQPVRQDVGNNPAEIRPEFGDIFAQNDFSHGSGQTYFHQLGRDPKRYFTSEGYDISEPGRLEHLHLLSPCFEDPQTGPMTQAGGLPFVGVGSVVRRGDGTMPGSWTDEDPSAGEGATEVLSLATEGDRLFAALGANGVHVRNAAGVWSHLSPDGVGPLVVSPATGVFWVKDRLMVIGGTDSRQIFEVIADSTPVAIDTLKEGWMFVDIGEAGGFIEACAVNLDAAQSVIYSYGLNDSADAIERKSSTPMPIGQLAWTVNGTIGTAFIGGGRANAQGGYDPFLYRATVNQLGELDYVLVRQERGASGADLSVRAITPIGDSVLLSWTLGSEASFGDARDGIAIYNLGRDSLARHLRREGAGGANKVLSILPYKGQILISIENFGLYFENLNAWVPTASVITSSADWNNAGDKVWDQIEIAHDPLPVGASVTVEYSTLPQVAEEWNTGIVSQTADSEGSSARLGNTLSRIFALRIASSISVAGRPVVQSFSVRSHPHPARPEWDLVRVIRLLDQDQKDDQAESVLQDPRTPMASLRRAVNTWITFYESGVTWTAFLTDVAKYEPAQPLYDTTGGEALKDAFVVQLQMTGTEG